MWKGQRRYSHTCAPVRHCIQWRRFPPASSNAQCSVSVAADWTWRKGTSNWGSTCHRSVLRDSITYKGKCLFCRCLEMDRPRYISVSTVDSTVDRTVDSTMYSAVAVEGSLSTNKIHLSGNCRCVYTTRSPICCGSNWIIAMKIIHFH